MAGHGTHGWGAALLAIVVAVAGRAEVALAPLFRDGAVLQRAKPVPVWGTAAPGETVRVRFGGQNTATTADRDGRWRVTLGPLAASATPADLEVAGSNMLRVANVLVGEVWLCSGQSNMAFRVSRATGAKADIPRAEYPLVRQFDMPAPGGSAVPTPTLNRWSATTPETVRYFTAVGYYFALELQRALNVPIGFIRAAAGGTPIETWVSAEVLDREAQFAVVRERWRETVAEDTIRRTAFAATLAAWEKESAAAKAEGRPPPRKRPKDPAEVAHNEPGGMFRGMIAPLVPYAVRGILWYQGESNHTRPAEYSALATALIRQWRTDFAQGDLPFLFVQLPNYAQPSDHTGELWALLREAQAQALALPRTGMAVGIDLGDAGDLHPPNKPELARRLAWLARAQVYGETIAAESPRAVAFTRQPGAMRVSFSAAAGLHLRGDPSAGVKLAGADHVFHPATLTVDCEAVIARSAAVPEPVAIRYAWANAPQVCLYNGAGLPAAPFRSDSW